MTRPYAWLSTLAAISSGCLSGPAEVDLDGPRITQSSLAANAVEVPVGSAFTLELSEPLAPGSVHAGSVALLAWERLDQACALSPICDEGRCVRGRCQRSPLSSTLAGAIEAGELESGGASVPVELELEAGLAGPGSRLVVRPRRPLAGHRRHTLALGPALRDRGRAPLVDELGRLSLWQRSFTTAAGGSSGPEPRLSLPAPGLREVPTNLLAVETTQWPPVPLPQPGATLALEADRGAELVTLTDPQPCPGFVPGACLRWTVAGSFLAEARYRVAGGSLVDRWGRAALRPGPTRETWFVTGTGPDQAGPMPLEAPTASQRGRCLVLWLDPGEAVVARLEVGTQTLSEALAEPGWLGLELDDATLGLGLGPGQLEWSLELVDLAGNVSAHGGTLALDPGLAELPALQITEVLANPLGPEPDAEFVELRVGAEAVTLEGLLISDRSPAELAMAWAAGEAPTGDPLPALALEPGALALVVAEDWAPGLGEDPIPPPDTPIVRVDASLGEGGLKNEGEAISVWREGPSGPVIVASYGNWIPTSASAHAGRSVVSGSDACDLPDRWRSHPSGRSSPGVLP